MNVYRNGPETDRLRHRAFVAADAPALFALNGDPRVMRYTHEPLLRSVEDARQAILHYPDFDEVGFGRWACVHHESDKVIGFCGLKYLKDLDEVDVGYRFLPDYWGQGLATEATTACLAFGFATLGLERIIALVLPENLASIRVLEKSGLQREEEFDYDGQRVLKFARARNSISET